MLLAALIMLDPSNIAPARAQPTGSSMFVPQSDAPDAPHRRSIDRPRIPGAWGISDSQWDKFKAFAIASGQKLTVSVRLNSLRARNFKDDLTELLSSIPGWQVNDEGTYTAGTLDSFDGIMIQNSSAVDPSPQARLIMDAFKAADIKPAPFYDPSEPGRVRIVIGAPPDK